MRAVAIPGELGSFSHAAALAAHQSEIRLVPCVDFPELFRTVVAGHADRGIVPIENSLTGSIHENYDLLRAHGLCIVDETEIRVRHCLIARPGTTLQQVRRVASHPVALAQCRRFFADHSHVVAVPAYDTAGSVRDLMNDRLDADAAIASDLAAQLYGGAILCEGLEDHAANYTRFLVVSRDALPAPRPVAATSKTSLVVTLANVPGSLHRALGPFARRGLDLSKIESRPLPGRPWEYVFYLDVLGDPIEVAAAIAELTEGAVEGDGPTSSVRVLGSYARNGALSMT
ncbi:MAG TPA: prephenate dehydratase [Gemmatimonadales bacterium]